MARVFEVHGQFWGFRVWGTGCVVSAQGSAYKSEHELADKHRAAHPSRVKPSWVHMEGKGDLVSILTTPVNLIMRHSVETNLRTESPNP